VTKAVSDIQWSCHELFGSRQIVEICSEESRMTDRATMSNSASCLLFDGFIKECLPSRSKLCQLRVHFAVVRVIFADEKMLNPVFSIPLSHLRKIWLHCRQFRLIPQICGLSPGSLIPVYSAIRIQCNFAGIFQLIERKRLKRERMRHGFSERLQNAPKGFRGISQITTTEPRRIPG